MTVPPRLRLGSRPTSRTGVPSTICIVSVRHQLPLGDSIRPASQIETSQYRYGPEAVHEPPLFSLAQCTNEGDGPIDDVVDADRDSQ